MYAYTIILYRLQKQNILLNYDNNKYGGNIILLLRRSASECHDKDFCSSSHAWSTADVLIYSFTTAICAQNEKFLANVNSVSIKNNRNYIAVLPTLRRDFY